MTMHPHDTPEAKAAHAKAQAEWYEQRYRDEVECYSARGFFREMKWTLLLIGLGIGLVWLYTRR